MDLYQAELNLPSKEFTKLSAYLVSHEYVRTLKESFVGNRIKSHIAWNPLCRKIKKPIELYYQQLNPLLILQTKTKFY